MPQGGFKTTADEVNQRLPLATIYGHLFISLKVGQNFNSQSCHTQSLLKYDKLLEITYLSVIVWYSVSGYISNLYSKRLRIYFIVTWWALWLLRSSNFKWHIKSSVYLFMMRVFNSSCLWLRRAMNSCFNPCRWQNSNENDRNRRRRRAWGWVLVFQIFPVRDPLESHVHAPVQVVHFSNLNIFHPRLQWVLERQLESMISILSGISASSQLTRKSSMLARDLCVKNHPLMCLPPFPGSRDRNGLVYSVSELLPAKWKNRSAEYYFKASYSRSQQLNLLILFEWRWSREPVIWCRLYRVQRDRVSGSSRKLYVGLIRLWAFPVNTLVFAFDPTLLRTLLIILVLEGRWKCVSFLSRRGGTWARIYCWSVFKL
jgi:hypothetical protein